MKTLFDKFQYKYADKGVSIMRIFDNNDRCVCYKIWDIEGNYICVSKEALKLIYERIEAENIRTAMPELAEIWNSQILKAYISDLYGIQLF